jgi:hypothetical protein
VVGNTEPGARAATHVEQRDDPWGINIPDHPARAESAGFRASKELAKVIAGREPEIDFWGSEAIHMHHGGSLYVLDGGGWFIVKNVAGVEWSAQFCADPAKVDQLRRNAVRLYAAFPRTIPAMVEMGYRAAARILSTPIADSDGVATWVDSIFNACVRIPGSRHTGVLPQGGGVHHYPTPITDIELVKHDDFVLWVTDPESGKPTAVVPTAPRGSGVATVQVVYASPGTDLHTALHEADAAGTALELAAGTPMATAAFVYQPG